MKFNWGHGITIFIIAFVGFILLMVVKAFNTSTDLTAENYYSQELSYGDRITAISNSNRLSEELVVKIGNENIEVILPKELQGSGVEGKVYFYRPDNAEMDVLIPINAEKQTQLIPKSMLISGNYTLEVSCLKATKDYFFSQEITITE